MAKGYTISANTLTGIILIIFGLIIGGAFIQIGALTVQLPIGIALILIGLWVIFFRKGKKR